MNWPISLNVCFRTKPLPWPTSGISIGRALQPNQAAAMTLADLHSTATW